MKFSSSLGIVSYGAYLPSFCIQATEIETSQGKEKSGIPQSLGVTQKTVPDCDEDTTTLATAAARQALLRLPQLTRHDEKSAHSDQIGQIGALFVGSESHPYAVKPTGTTVKQAVGLSENMSLADLQFACKAGTQGLQTALAHVGAGLCDLALAIGADTAQSRPGDVLEFTAGAGAAGYVVGKRNVLAEVVATLSIATDTPDFWRRPGQKYPQHAGRFSGEPAYFYHVSTAAKKILAETGLTPNTIDYCVFHTPNAKFPQAAAAKLGFTPEQLEPSLIVKTIGNTYAAAVPLALAAVLDQASANQTILVVSYGSGSGSDAFIIKTTPALIERRQTWTNLVTDQMNRLIPISYQHYQESMNTIG